MAASQTLTATCAVADFDAATQSCAQVQWVQQESSVSLLPPLTASEGFAISGAVAACWVIGFLVRVFRKQMGY